MKIKQLLVVVPHSGIIIPAEIPLNSLSEEFPSLAKNVDWYTHWLYDFEDLLGNSTVIFPWSSLILEANRNPNELDTAVPLVDTLGRLVYKPGHEPAEKLRRRLARKYLDKFHNTLSRTISRGRIFMLDGHSTVTARGVAANQIELMNYQILKPDGAVQRFCPDAFIYTYAEELSASLEGIKITVNESGYHHVYGHICGRHSVDAERRFGDRVPAILQETNMALYMNSDGTPNLPALERLRRAFARSLAAMLQKMSPDLRR
ncbi:MAG: N-formylglutamate amidohydrolase [Dehalococcoidaceae bacterium]|nr:N-formylglutamate amidohydrolase [Dehalococcoidaceae bacterium]